MLRAIIVAISAIGGAISVGRKFADKSLEKRIGAEVDAAKDRAIAELDREIDLRVDGHLRRYGLTLLIKAGLVAVVYLFHASGVLTGAHFRWAIGGLIFLFIVYDLFRMLPQFPIWLSLVRDYGFNLKEAVKDYVATVAFERAYHETNKELNASRRAQALIAVSTYSARRVSDEVATAVAEVVAGVSFDRLKPRVMLGLLKILGMVILYMGFVALIVWG